MMDTPVSPARTEPVSFGQKVSYGAAGMVDIWSMGVASTMIYQIFNMELGIAAAYISVALLIFNVVNSVTDPLAGWMTDNTRTRWGRRRAWIFVGALGFGLLFPIAWHFPGHLTHEAWVLGWGGASVEVRAALVWFAGFSVLSFCIYSFWNMPYQSLLLEMSPDYNERTRITAFRAVFQSLAGLTMGSIWWLSQRSIFGDPETGEPDSIRGMQWISVGVGVLIFLLGVLPMWARKTGQGVKL